LLLEDRNNNINRDPTLFNLRNRKIKVLPTIILRMTLDTFSCLKIISGMNFWILIKINISMYPKLGRILNNQEWKGGTPNLNKIANLLTNIIILRSEEIMTLAINNKEAALCEIKYFNPFNTESSLIFTTSRGITDSIFISKHTH